MEEIMKVTEEDMKNLFWQQTLHAIRQDKLIKVLHERVNRAELDKGDSRVNITEFQRAHGV